MDLMLRRRELMLATAGGVPSGLKKCLWIGPSEYSGQNPRYINTGIIVDPNHTSLVVDFMFTNNNNAAIIGSSFNNGYAYGGVDALGYYMTYGGRCSYGKTDLGYSPNGLMPGNNIRNTVEYNWRGKYILNRTTGVRYNIGVEYVAYGDYPLVVFLKTYGPFSTTGVGRLYGLTIYYDDDPVLNYEPYIDASSNPCVYDTIAGEVVYPTGSASLTYTYELDI